MARTLAGVSIDIVKPPTSDDLKFPLLWLTQAHAMAEAARIIIESQPKFENMPYWSEEYVIASIVQLRLCLLVIVLKYAQKE